MKRAISVLLTVYASVPVIFYLFPWILGHAIFAHMLRFPFFVDLGRPEDVLNHTCNFYLNTEEGISVGVWHTLPSSQWEKSTRRSPQWYQETLGDDAPVIIYLHGNVGTRWDKSSRKEILELILMESSGYYRIAQAPGFIHRNKAHSGLWVRINETENNLIICIHCSYFFFFRAINHRVQLVKILSAAGYHVLSLDYRGFGDSTGEPSEAGLTNDAIYLYHWVKKHSRESLVCLWGHSLGSGVATNAAVKIQEQGSPVDALILEAPYTRIGDVVVNHPFTKMYRFLPGFESLLWNVLERINIVFANDKNLKTLTSPLLILHSEDDNVVPYRMGLELYQISLQTQRKFSTDAHIDMITYSANLGFSHRYIYLDPNLSAVIRKFLQNL